MFKDLIEENFIRDDLAQVFSLDVLFSIIIITVIIGVSVNAMDFVGFKIADYSAGESLDRITADAAQILINTPGSPGWENCNSSLGVTPGLAENINGSRNSTNILSIKKISQLQSRYSELMGGKVIPRGEQSSLTIYPTNPVLKPIVVNNLTSPPGAGEVAVANRSVLVDFKRFTTFTVVYTQLNNSWNNESRNNSQFCPHHNISGIMEHQRPNFSSKTPGWTCNNFKLGQQDVNSTDFYILTDPPASDNSAQWILDRPDNLTEESQKFNTNPIKVNDRICQVLGDDEIAVIWFHIFTSGEASKAFNVYLVGVPKGTSSGEVKAEYLNPQPCFFVLKVWN